MEDVECTYVCSSRVCTQGNHDSLLLCYLHIYCPIITFPSSYPDPFLVHVKVSSDDLATPQVKARTLTRDEELRKLMSSMKEEGKLVPCDASAKKLLQIIQKDEYKSGEHIDFFDV